MNSTSFSGVLSVGTVMPSASMRWRLGGRGQADEAAMVKIGIAQFLHGRHVGPGRNPVRARDGERTQFAVVRQRLGLRIVREGAVNSARCHVAGCLAGAAIG